MQKTAFDNVKDDLWHCGRPSPESMLTAFTRMFYSEIVKHM